MVHSAGSSMERQHVRDVYDQIAPHFTDLQQKAWPKVKQFLKGLPVGSLVADVGCGNGRYLKVNNSVYKVGSDICQPFVQHASENGLEVISADNLHLPYRDGIFDAVISIGVLHHFSNKRRRIQALKELTRVLSPGGKLMVYVWAFEQKHRRFESQDVLVPWHKPSSVSRRLCRGSYSDLDSNSSVSDDDTASLRSFSLTQDSPSDSLRSGNRNSSFDDLSNFADDVFEVDIPQNGIHPSGDGCQDDHHPGNSLVRECRRIEACLKELSEKTLLPASKYNFRKKTPAEITSSTAAANIQPKFANDFGSSTVAWKPQRACVPTTLPLMPHSRQEIDTLAAVPDDGHTHGNHQSSSIGSKPGLFHKFKQSLQELVMPNRKSSDEVGSTRNGNCPPENGFSDFPDFAVREFPQSSLRYESMKPFSNGTHLNGNGFHAEICASMPDLLDRSITKQLNGVGKDVACPMSRESPEECSSPRLSRGRKTPPQNGCMVKSTSTYEVTSRSLKLIGLHRGNWHSQGQLSQATKATKSTGPRDISPASCQRPDNDLDLRRPPFTGSQSIPRSGVLSNRLHNRSSSSGSLYLNDSGNVSNGNADLCRYYHVFKEGELNEMVRGNIAELDVTETFLDHANWCLIAEKLPISN